MRKKLIAILASIGLVAVSVPVLATSNESTGLFVDVPSSHWAADAIHEAQQSGYIVGMGENRFAPDATLTNAQFLVMVNQAFLPGKATSVELAKDDAWWKPYVQTASAEGLLKGTGIASDNGSADAGMSRYDMAMLAYNILEMYSIDSPSESILQEVSQQIGDGDEIPDHYKSEVVTVYALGILAGKDENGRFYGADKLTRAEACVVTHALLKTMKEYYSLYDLEVALWCDAPMSPVGIWSQIRCFDTAPTVTAMEAPVSYFASDGSWEKHSWDGFEAECFYKSDGSYSVYAIRSSRPELKTTRGIGVGASLDDLELAYPDMVTEDDSRAANKV